MPFIGEFEMIMVSWRFEEEEEEDDDGDDIYSADCVYLCACVHTLCR